MGHLSRESDTETSQSPSEAVARVTLGEGDQMRRTSGGDAAARTGGANASGTRKVTAKVRGPDGFESGAPTPATESGDAEGATEQQSRWTARNPASSEQQACFAEGVSIMQVERHTTIHERA
jgi:hypothetical protein